MDVFRRALGDWRCLKLRFPFGQKKFKEKPNSLNKYEYYVYKFQSIVIWEHPTQTVSCLLLIQLLFWMIVNLCWKFYGILFTLLLIFCTHDVWTERIWPEIRLPQPDVIPYQQDFTSNPRILTTGQIEEYFNNLLLHAKMMVIRIRRLRNSHPTSFCTMFTVGLSILATVGCLISGIWLLYMVVMTIFLSPGIYIYVVPEYIKASISQYFNDHRRFKMSLVANRVIYSDEDDEYVPQLSKEKIDEAYATEFQVNDRGNDFSSLYNDDDDDLPCGDALPSFDDTSIDELDHLSDDAKMNLEFSETSSTTSDESSSSPKQRIKFKGAHFDNEEAGELETTSEEENENAFLPDLQHRRKTSASDSSSPLSAFVSGLTLPNLNLMRRNLLTSIIPSLVTSSQAEKKTTVMVAEHSHRDNTDDEFEFINESDLN